VVVELTWVLFQIGEDKVFEGAIPSRRLEARKHMGSRIERLPMIAGKFDVLSSLPTKRQENDLVSYFIHQSLNDMTRLFIEASYRRCLEKY
jgi:hypothetical protein